MKELFCLVIQAMQKKDRNFLKIVFFFLLNWIQKRFISQTLLKLNEKKDLENMGTPPDI